MEVREVVANYLKENGYDGLYVEGCGCGLDDLIPCDGNCKYCEPAYKHVCPGDGSCDNASACESGGAVGIFCYGPAKTVKKTAPAKEPEPYDRNEVRYDADCDW